MIFIEYLLFYLLLTSYYYLHSFITLKNVTVTLDKNTCYMTNSSANKFAKIKNKCFELN